MFKIFKWFKTIKVQKKITIDTIAILVIALIGLIPKRLPPITHPQTNLSPKMLWLSSILNLTEVNLITLLALGVLCYYLGKISQTSDKIEWINANDKIKYKIRYRRKDLREAPEKLENKMSSPICISCGNQLISSQNNMYWHCTCEANITITLAEDRILKRNALATFRKNKGLI